jgi:hypothetical protein
MSFKPKSKSKRYGLRVGQRSILNDKNEVVKKVTNLTLFASPVPSKNKPDTVFREGSISVKAVLEGIIGSTESDMANVRALSEKDYAKEIALFRGGEPCSLNEVEMYSGFFGMYHNVQTDTRFIYGVLKFRDPHTGAKIELSSADYDLNSYLTPEALDHAKVIDTPAFLLPKSEQADAKTGDDEVPLDDDAETKDKKSEKGADNM